MQKESPDGFFHQDLVHQGCLKSACHDGAELVFVVDQAAAGAAHGVGGTQNDRVAQLLRDGETFLDTVGHFTAGHLDAQHVHGILEFHTVLTALNGIYLDADHFDIVFVKDPFLIELGRQVQSGLSAEVRQQGVGPFFGDDLLKTIYVQRLDISDIGHLRVCHDGGRIGVHQYDLVSETAERFAGLRA